MPHSLCLPFSVAHKYLPSSITSIYFGLTIFRPFLRLSSQLRINLLPGFCLSSRDFIGHGSSISIPSVSELVSHLEEAGRQKEAEIAELLKMARTQRDEQRDDQRDSGPQPGPSNPNPPLIHPSFTQVTQPFLNEATIQACFEAMGVSRSREESLRLMGVNWIHSVRKALHLYVERSCPRATSDELLITYTVRSELSTLL
jgi:hypothetical protein